MIWTEERKKSFFEKGFVIFEEPELVELIGDDFELLNRQERLRDNFKKDMTSELNQRFNTATEYIRFKYMASLFDDFEFVKYGCWEGVDTDNTYWHNDFFEGMNCFFLLYCQDQAPETGGSISFQWPGGEETIYPKRGTLAMLNQRLDFYHKAEKSKIERRICAFDFHVPELDN